MISSTKNLIKPKVFMEAQDEISVTNDTKPHLKCSNNYPTSITKI